MEILERFLRGFSIVLTVEDAIHLFSNLLCILHLDLVELQTRKPWIIYNSSEAPDAVTPAVNSSSDKFSAPKAMQFGPCLT